MNTCTILSAVFLLAFAFFAVTDARSPKQLLHVRRLLSHKHEKATGLGATTQHADAVTEEAETTSDDGDDLDLQNDDSFSGATFWDYIRNLFGLNSVWQADIDDTIEEDFSGNYEDEEEFPDETRDNGDIQKT